MFLSRDLAFDPVPSPPLIDENSTYTDSRLLLKKQVTGQISYQSLK
jgi:hypothetical protein